MTGNTIESVRPTTPDLNMQKKSFLSVSCGASVLMVVYLGMGMLNLYRLMYPLAFIDVSSSHKNMLVGPLWEEASQMRIKVYLSTRDKFQLDFLRYEFVEEGSLTKNGFDSILLWQDDMNTASRSKSFVLTSLDVGGDCGDTTRTAVDRATCAFKVSNDPSYAYASAWLDHADEHAEGGILSEFSASAGEGIESTSVLLTAYNLLAENMGHALRTIGIGQTSSEEPQSDDSRETKQRDRTIVAVPYDSPLWSALQSNSTLHVHVVVARDGIEHHTMEDAQGDLQRSLRSHSLLLGHVDLVKYELPHHILPPKRILYHDVSYVLKRFLLRCLGSDDASSRPPWEMEYSKPEEYATYQESLTMKQQKVGFPYWKPEVSVKYINDDVWYPMDYVGLSGFEPVRLTTRSASHPSGVAQKPSLHVDEIGMTSDKYIPVNETVTSLPLRITFDRNDMEQPHKRATATAGGLSPARWRLLTHLSGSLESQKELGFEQSDIDDLRRLIADTNVTLLAITMLASGLHLLFEFLTFKNEVSFWRNNKDLTGLSVRSLFLDMIGQVVILLFLIEKDSSLLMTIPSGVGCLIALWKCQRGAGFTFVRLVATERMGPAAWWNVVPRLMGYELRATRLHAAKPTAKSGKKGTQAPQTQNLRALTDETDRIATRTLGSVLLPLVIAYTIYSLVMEEHTGWYSWLITSASSAVYALGFVLMTPQLFLNYKLKSVAHLPWRVLVYKFLNTFIDDLFAFIIRMPTMARISCFRDDIVFVVYLYQRWLYPVDTSRPVEGGDGPMPTASDEPAGKEKKKQ